MDRDPRVPLFLFKKGAVVHFAVDPDEVHMATRLNGSKTYFLPFNSSAAIPAKSNAARVIPNIPPVIVPATSGKTFWNAKAFGYRR